MVEAVLSSYLWLVVLGAFGAFIFGYGTGANDVANAFGTSVGAKTLSLKQAVLIAAIFEFGGALVLGRVSTSTIAGGIADINVFYREPEMYAYGMMIALMVSGTWNILASYFELNVSSTHSIIGSIIGFSLIYGGGGAVNWATPDSASFPPYKGVVPIIVTWFFAPIATGVASAVLFLFCRHAILRRDRAVLYSLIALPVLVFATVWICIFFVLTKGAKKMIASNDKNWNDEKSRWVSAVVGVGCAVVMAVTVVPFLVWKLKKRDEEAARQASGAAEAEAAAAAKAKDVEGGKDGEVTISQEDEVVSPTSSKFSNALRKSMSRSFKAITHGVNVDIHEAVEEDEVVAEIHRNAEVFNPKVEYCFSFLQVFSAICVVFAHGAGEVGYMAGPLATIWDVYKNGKISKSTTASIWIILISAFGLVIGLATYGYKCTRGMGVRLSKLSPSRGFCAELATASIILLASQYGLPTSSSQCVTGGIIGVGLCEGAKGVNWKFFLKQFSSWVGTLIVVGFITAAIFAQGIYAPSKPMGEQMMTYEDRLTNFTATLYKNYNDTLNSYSKAPVLLGNQNPAVWNYANLSKAIKSASDSAKALTNTKTQTVDADLVMDAMLRAVALYQTSSVFALGQTQVFVNASGVCNNNATEAAACIAPNMIPKGVKVKAVL